MWFVLTRLGWWMAVCARIIPIYHILNGSLCYPWLSRFRHWNFVILTSTHVWSGLSNGSWFQATFCSFTWIHLCINRCLLKLLDHLRISDLSLVCERVNFFLSVIRLPLIHYITWEKTKCYQAIINNDFICAGVLKDKRFGSGTFIFLELKRTI